MLMTGAQGVSTYTASQIKPLLETQMKYTFLPQSVPAYSAAEVLGKLQKDYPEYSFKSAMLNPTNPRDRAVAWEEDIVNQFKHDIKDWELENEINLIAQGPDGKRLFGSGGSAEEFEKPVMEDWAAVLRVNLSAPAALTRSLLPALRRAPAGTVIFTLDSRGHDPAAAHRDRRTSS